MFLSTWLDAADARPSRTRQIPNGWVNGCANCHESDGAGGPRNPFGQTIEDSFLSTPGPTGVVLWGPGLAALDSDGDGRTNGQELLDPAGAWSFGQPDPGDPALVRLPGFADPTPVPALPFLGASFFALSLAGIGVGHLRRRARLG